MVNSAQTLHALPAQVWADEKSLLIYVMPSSVSRLQICGL